MEQIDLGCWDELEGKLSELRSRQEGQTASPLLFRGQSNAEWPLTTTLERSDQTGMRLIDYYRLIHRVAPQIETFTGIDWNLPPPDRMEAQLGEPNHPLGVTTSVYGYIIYLRHYGFPSPLLDWTRSPYVAAFFGFREAMKAEEGRVAIYVYWDAPEGVEGGWGSLPRSHHSGAVRPKSSNAFSSTGGLYNLLGS